MRSDDTCSNCMRFCPEGVVCGDCDGTAELRAELATAQSRIAELEADRAALQAQAAVMRTALRPVLWSFALRMEAALKRNDYKGGWRRDLPSALFRRLCEESSELALAMSQGVAGNDCVTEEAADVANFAMMLADLSNRMEPADFGDAGRTALAEREAERAELAALREVADELREDHGKALLAGHRCLVALAKLDALRAKGAK